MIEVRDLHKHYRVRKPSPGPFAFVRSLVAPRVEVVEAVRGISFDVEAGECVGYLGPNGAGKSTTIKILTGILVPTRGEVRVAGLVPWRDRRRNAHQIGVVFGQRTQLYWDLPLRETLEVLRRIYQVPVPVYQENMNLFRNLLGIGEFLDVPVRQLSLGQRMRGDLAAALLHSPSILYLDEPTIGLDVIAKAHMLDIIRELNRTRGVTVLLTTHNLAEIEQLCPRILLIDRGRLSYDGGLEQFRRRYAPYRTLVVQLANDASGFDVPGVRVVRREGRQVEIRLLRDEPAHQVISRVTERYEVRDLSLTEPSLEQVIRGLYGAREGGRGDVECGP